MGKVDGFKAKLPWLFGTHYKIERFGVIFFAMLLCIGVCFGLAQKKSMDDAKVQLGDQVMYTTEIQMSVSHAKATVTDIRVSEDKQRCFIMLHWPDMTNVVTDASAYSLFLCASDVDGDYESELLSRPVGSVYMFGATGYMGIYLVDTNGFQSQILGLTLRSNNNFVPADGSAPIADNLMGDSSFLTNDQARIYFNPGGASAQTATCLEDDNMTAYNIYCSFFAEAEEQSIKDSMYAALETMYEQTLVIDNIMKPNGQLSTVDLQTPITPMLVSEVDNVYVDENGVRQYDQIFDFDEEGKPVELHAAVDLDRSILFDWQNGDIHTGYQDEVLTTYPYENLTRLLDAKSAVTETFSFSTNMTWYDIAGQVYTRSTSASTPMSTNRNSVISSLTTAWQAFYDAKVEYQVTLPVELLTLERNAREMMSLYTVNQNVLLAY